MGGRVRSAFVSGMILIGLCVSSAFAERAVGDWGGTLAGTLRLVVHIKKDGTGSYSGMLESVDQGDSKIPLDGIKASNDHLFFTAPEVKGNYDGKWDVSTQTWVGSWSQGKPLALTLKRMDASGVDALMPKRPQEEAIAKAAKAFRSREVIFPGAHSGPELAGTLSLPDGEGPFPGVILVSGSGRNTRDEVVSNHKIFYVLAEYLNRRGLAVLRYDKRGVGASKGSFDGATTEDFANDAQGAVEFLKTEGDVDPKRIGMLGHSEGGLIVPAVAARDASASFVVLVSAPGVRGAELMTDQLALISAADGMAPSKVALERDFHQKLFDAVAASTSRGEAEKIVRDMAAQGRRQNISGADHPDDAVKWITDPWFLYFLKYEPAPALRQIKIPVLALAGSLDLQVPPAANVPALREALKGNPDATILQIDGMNHLLQKCRTGSPIEYGQIEETMDPKALEAIGDWIVAHCKKSSTAINPRNALSPTR